MARWSEVESEAPELALLARRIFDAHIHKTISELVVTRVEGEPPALVIESWHPRRGVSRLSR